MSNEMEFNDAKEVAPLTEEQWERIISWHRKRSGKEIVQVLISAREFATSMEKIQRMAGCSQESIEEVSQALLDMAKAQGGGQV